MLPGSSSALRFYFHGCRAIAQTHCDHRLSPALTDLLIPAAADRASAQEFDPANLTRSSRLEAVLGDVVNAAAAVRAELEKILMVKQGTAAVPPSVLNPN